MSFGKNEFVILHVSWFVNMDVATTLMEEKD
jgi:hypothetical protein